MTKEQRHGSESKFIPMRPHEFKDRLHEVIDLKRAFRILAEYGCFHPYVLKSTRIENEERKAS